MYTVQVFFDFMKQHKWTLVFYMICTCLAYPIESILLPQLYSSFFDQIGKTPTQEVFLYYFGLMFLLICTVNLSNIITNFIEAKILPEWKGYFMDWIFKHLLKIYENKMTDIELGKLIVDLIILPRLTKDIITETITWVLPRVLSVLIIHIYFFFVDWRLGLLSLFILVLYALTFYFSFFRCPPLAELEHQQFEEKMQKTQDRLSNTFSIYSSGNVHKEIEEYRQETDDYVIQDKLKMECVATANVYTSFFIIGTMMALNGYTTHLFLQKSIPFKTLMSIFMIVMYYIPSITSINLEIPSLVVRAAIIESKDPFIGQLYQYYDESKNKLPGEKGKHQLRSGKIEIRDLTFSYSEDKPLLNHFHLQLKDKSKVAVVGPSGSGKSSLIKLIMGYYPVPDGTIFIDGVDINQYELNHLRKQIGYVNQNTKLFNMTLLENICYGSDDPGSCSRDKITALMEQMGIQDIFRNVDLEDNVGVDGNKLSGGQRQIVHMLRCILRQNKIVILDEPTSALDPELKAAVVRAIKIVSRNSTLIIITHDESILFLTDRAIRFG